MSDDDKSTELERIRVWPKEGVLVRDELTRAPLTPGQTVLKTRAIERRLSAGDLTTEDPAAQKTERLDKERGVMTASTSDQPMTGEQAARISGATEVNDSITGDPTTHRVGGPDLRRGGSK